MTVKLRSANPRFGRVLFSRRVQFCPQPLVPLRAPKFGLSTIHSASDLRSCHDRGAGLFQFFLATNGRCVSAMFRERDTRARSNRPRTPLLGL